jgi:hypothetical protein
MNGEAILMSNVTGSIAYMGAEEFLNTFLFMWSFDEAKVLMKKYLNLPEGTNPFVKEGIESAEQLVVTMGIFKLIQHTELWLQFLFEMGKVIIVALLSLGKKGFNKLKGHLMKGRRFKFMSEMLGSVLDDAIEKCKVFVAWIQALIDGRKSSFESGQMIEASQTNRSNVIQRDQSAMTLGKGLSENLINSLMFKLMTKTFNQQDEILLRKILGRQDVGDLHVDDMNKVANFMYVTDINGNPSGLSEQMMSLLNGMGYVHKTAPTV